MSRAPVFKFLPLLIVSGALIAPTRAHAGDQTSIFSLGIHMYSGEAKKSATGSSGYLMQFQNERKKGFFRPTFSAELQMATGTASLASATSSFTLYGAGFLGGFNLFFIQEGGFQPFFGACPVLAWNLMKLGSPPTGVDENTQGLAFGYELHAGLDWRPGSADGRAMRIQSTYYQASSTLAKVSGFQLGGFRFSLGFTF